MRLHERRPTARVAAPDPAREERLREWTRAIAAPRNFREEPRENARVRRLVADELERLGYSVSIQGRFANVVALPRERTDLTLVGAHYDSVPACPGADDNASGVAVLLEVAAAIASREPRLGFVAFNAEEDGIAGSADFVAHGLDEHGLDVRGIHVLEMVGFSTDAPGSQTIPYRLPAPDRGNFLGLLANGRSHGLLDRAFERAPSAAPDLGLIGLKTYLGIERVLPLLNLSDHAPFWRAGIPAAMWTDTAFLRNPHYHQASDTWDTLDYGFMERVAALVIASVTS